MAIHRSTFLLLIAVVLFGPASLFISQAQALQGVGPPPARRADHVDLNARMIKKRGPAPVPIVARQATGSVTPTPTPSNTDTTRDTNDNGSSVLYYS